LPLAASPCRRKEGNFFAVTDEHPPDSRALNLINEPGQLRQECDVDWEQLVAHSLASLFQLKYRVEGQRGL
jgi:hypothetical protein